MKQSNYEIAKELKKRIFEIITLIDIKVFGSRARDEENEYSDMDVFLEVDSINKELKKKISDVVWEIGFEHYIVISPLIFTRDEIESPPLKTSLIVKNILKEGVAV